MGRAGDPVSEADRDGIERAARDYVEGWLEGDGARLASALHPVMAKRAALDPTSGSLELDEIGDLERWTAAVTARGPKVDVSRDYELEILDVFGGIATVRVLSEPYMDYLHLARFRDRWLIVNALYEDREG